MKLPMPADEFERVLNLTEFNLDYSTLESNFRDLTRLAAKVAGTKISLVNLIDSFTQWTIAGHGLEITQMSREDSVCQYTIMEDHHFEVVDLSADERFKDKFYVAKDPALRYYYGIPLKSGTHHVGALCVLDQDFKQLSAEKIEMLQIIGEEIVNRLKTFKVIEELRSKVLETKTTQNKVVHDIRGPIGGIIGLAQIISQQGDQNKMEEVLEFINMIHKSGNSILDLADEILTAEYANNKTLRADQVTLDTFRENLERLYVPQAKSKNICLKISTTSKTAQIPISRTKLLQIAGNLISNAIKFTPQSGVVEVDLSLDIELPKPILKIEVSDSGAGLTQEEIMRILAGTKGSSAGTSGESGYGFGLALVQHLLENLGGTLEIQSEKGTSTRFIVMLAL